MMLVACNERDGTRIRSVKMLSRDPKHLVDVWARLRTVSNCFNGKEGDGLTDPNNIILEVDDVGILVLDDKERLGDGGRVHITFWDRKLRGREYLCRRVAERWMEEFKLHYLYTIIPEGARTVAAFCRRVGFYELERSEVGITLAICPARYLHGVNSLQVRH